MQQQPISVFCKVYFFCTIYIGKLYSYYNDLILISTRNCEIDHEETPYLKSCYYFKMQQRPISVFLMQQ